MKELTLLITVHSKYDSVDFFIERFEKYNKYFDVIFAFDNNFEELSKNLLNKIMKSKYEYFISGKNNGKLDLVIKSSKKIKTKFFKIIDQDDSVYFGEIDSIVSSLKDIDDTNLIKHKAIKLNKNHHDLFIQSNDETVINEQINHGTDVHLAQQINCDTIYPTKIIQLMNDYSFTRQQFHNDVLLSNFCIGNGSKLIKINNKFYIHFLGFGQTSNVSIDRSEGIVELYNNYLHISNENPNWNFRKLMMKKKLFHKLFISAFTRWYLKKELNEKGIEFYNHSIEILDILWKK